MNENYAAWITRYAAKRKYLRGACGPATAEMVATFPELRRVAGWANGAEHFWCETADGEIVDPTRGQFGGGSVEYQEFKPGDSVRVGKCMNCGDEIHGVVQSLDDLRPMLPEGASSCACSVECSRELEESTR